MPGPIFITRPTENVPGTAFAGDNKARLIYAISFGPNLPKTIEKFIEILNNASFVVQKDEQAFFSFSRREIYRNDSEFIKTTFALASGAGEYGPGKKQIIKTDLIEISTVPVNPLNDPDADFFEVGEIGDAALHDFFNENGFDFDVKLSRTNYFKVLRAGIQETYLFNNQANLFGARETFRDYDFELLARDGENLNSSKVPKTLSELTDDIGATDLKTILVREKSQIVNQELDPKKTYKVAVPALVLGADDSIIVPAGGLILKGYGYNVTSIVQPNENGVIYTSPEGGSGNINLIHINSVASGAGARVFDLVDVDGEHEVGFNSVNFSGCDSLGTINNYRQGTGDDVGVYGCADGLTLAGNWNGFKIESTNVFGFGAAGTLFKKAADTSFSNRFFINLNIDFPMGAALCDFGTENFEAPELFQINSSIAKVEGVIDIDAAGWLLPNISANDIKSLWVGNIGLPDTATELLTENDNVSGQFEIDWLKDTYFLTLTGDTAFTQINLPANTKNTQEIRLYVTGEFIPTFPLGWSANLVGTYKGADVNEIAIKYIRDGVYFVRISNTLTVYPAPIIGQLQPAGLLPEQTQELLISGSFFTPKGFAKISGQQINSLEFLPETGYYRASITTGAEEGDFDIVVNNGSSTIKERALTISLGEVYKLLNEDFQNVSPSINLDFGDLIKNDVSVSGIAETIFALPRDINWEIRINQRISPLHGSYNYGDPYLSGALDLSFRKVSDDSAVFNFYDVSESGVAKFYTDGVYGKSAFVISSSPDPEYWNDNAPLQIRYNKDNLTVKVIYKGQEKGVKTLPAALDSDLYMRFSLKQMNVKDIKYIELATQ